MLSDIILDAIDEVSSTKEFNALLYKWGTLSDADDELKAEAIRELKARKSVFDTEAKYTPLEVYENIKAGQADIGDIN